MGEKNLSNCSGIYVILNIIDCKAYVGQALKFNNRDHIYELEKGLDNTNLQTDYDNDDLEFVYMVLIYLDEEISKDELNRYEKFYMTLMEEFGFELYNEQCNNSTQAKNNRKIDRLGFSEEFHNDAQNQFINDFISRFDIEPCKLASSCRERRKQALEYYANKRLQPQGMEEFKKNGDRFLFSRQRIQRLFTKKIEKDNSLDIDEVFVSKAGGYLGEGIDQILHYECEIQKNRNYCLWTFSANAVSYENVKKHCEKRQKEHKNTYVLFEYTASNVYASAEPKIFSKLRKKYALKLAEEERTFLSFYEGSYGHYYVPEDINCTATGETSVRAFVIQDFYFIDGVYNYDEACKKYKVVCADKLKDIDRIGCQRSTYFMSANQANMKLSDITEKPSRRKFCFIGKLVAPYIIPLECE